MRGTPIRRRRDSLAAAMAASVIVGASLHAVGPENQREKPLRRAGPSATTCLPPEDVSGLTGLLRLRNEERAAKAMKAKQVRKGDVVVIEDQGSIVMPEVPPKPFDLLGPVHIDLTPVPGGFAIARGEGPLEPPLGQEIFLVDDDTAEVALSFAFPFYGSTYTSIWVNSDGNITLGEGDADTLAPRDAARLASGPPRIAPFYADLLPQFDPSSSIRVAVSADRAVVSWTRIFPGLGSGGGAIGDSHEIRAILDASGAIRLSLGTLPETLVVVGVAAGRGAGPVRSIDYRNDLPATVIAGAIYEEFGTHRPFDLASRNLIFTPAPGGFGIASGPLDFDEGIGDALAVTSRTGVEVTLPFAFPFLGETHESIFVHSRGNITLAGTARSSSFDPNAFLRGVPRIAALFAFLTIEGGGSIHADVRADRAVLSWMDVPDLGDRPQTFQAVLHADGTITFAYRNVDPTPILNAVIGVTAGGYLGPTSEVDFSADLPAMRAARAVFELFGPIPGHCDLFDRSITFAPTAGGFRAEFAGAHDPGVGHPVPLGCNFFLPEAPCTTTIEVPLGFTFPFLGAAHDSMFVNSNGTITFGEGDETEGFTAGRLLVGPPRLSPIGAFLEPGALAFTGVRVDVGAGRAHVTWDTFNEDFDTGEIRRIAVQAALYPDGSVRFTYSAMEGDPVIGLAEGGGAGPVHEVDFSADLPAELEAGAIFEEFGEGRFATFDLVQMAREFYASHEDRFDFLVVFTDFPVELVPNSFQQVRAFHRTVSNATSGLGIPILEMSADFGSTGELESIVAMNNIFLYWPDAKRLVDPPFVDGPLGRERVMGQTDGGPLGPAGAPYTLLVSSPMSVLAHEVGHRWLVHASLVHPVTGIPDSFTIAFPTGHWRVTTDTRVPEKQFKGDPRASSLEGNVIVDIGTQLPPEAGFECRPGQRAYITHPDELNDGYTELDQYFMGIRRDAEVQPFFFVDDIEFRLVFPDVTVPNQMFCGTPIDLTVADIQAHPGMGPRIPALGDEDDDGKGNDVKTMAFILLTQRHDPAEYAEAAGRVQTFLETWKKYANGPATAGRGRFEVRLDER